VPVAALLRASSQDAWTFIFRGVRQTTEVGKNANLDVLVASPSDEDFATARPW